ncbi:MAG: restriction endonuclease subunit S [Cyclobacteriaceae bacterium]
MSKVPKLRFKEFSGGWELKKLSQLLEFKNGINASKEQYGSGFKFINVLDILNNDFITHDLIIGSVDVDESVFEKYSVNYGDILFQRSSETREEVGTACVYLDSKPATFGGFVIRGKKIGEYDPMFLNKLLKTDLSRNEITSKSGGSTRYNVGQETLSSVALPFPSLPEQQKIASFLSAVDEKLQQLTRKKEFLEQYKKGVMQQLFSGKLRFEDENGKPYAKWEEKRLGDIGKIRMCKRVFNNETSQTGDVPFYKIGTFGKEADAYITLDHYLSFKEKYPFPKVGEILISAAGTLGRTVIYDGRPAYFQDSNIVWIENDEKLVTNSFLYFVYQIVKYDSEGGTIQRLYNNIISSAKFSKPSIEEQQKIASFLTALDAKIESVATQIAHTQTFKKGLLQQMFV